MHPGMLLDIQLLEHHALMSFCRAFLSPLRAFQPGFSIIALKGEGFEGEPAGWAKSDLYIIYLVNLVENMWLCGWYVWNINVCIYYMHRCRESLFHFRSFGFFQASCFRNQKAKQKHPIISIRINNHGFSVCCAGYRSSWHRNFFQRDFPQEEGNDLAKVGDKTEVDGSMGSMGCLHWRFHVMFAKTTDVQGKEGNAKKYLESPLRSVLHVALFFSRKRDMLNGEFPGRYINDIWEKWLWWSWKTRHFWPVTLNRTLQALKKYEKGIRLLGWPGVGSWKLGTLMWPIEVVVYLSIYHPGSLFFLLFFCCWVFVSCFFFLGKGNKTRKPWRIMSWWKLIKWFEWRRWEPLKRRKEKVVLVVLQLKTTSYSASLYSKIGHHMFARSTIKIENMFLQKDGLKKDFSFKYIWDRKSVV